MSFIVYVLRRFSITVSSFPPRGRSKCVRAPDLPFDFHRVSASAKAWTVLCMRFLAKLVQWRIAFKWLASCMASWLQPHHAYETCMLDFSSILFFWNISNSASTDQVNLNKYPTKCAKRYIYLRGMFVKSVNHLSRHALDSLLKVVKLIHIKPAVKILKKLNIAAYRSKLKILATAADCNALRAKRRIGGFH